MIYLDSSAIVKLVIAERESRALQRFLAREPTARVSCGLARTEVLRAARAHGPVAVARARSVLQTVELLHFLGPALLDAAGRLDPPTLRSLDAIHLAAASRFASALTALVTYDKRMAAGAALLGLPVVAPA